MKSNTKKHNKIPRKEYRWLTRKNAALIFTAVTLAIYGQTMFFGFTWFDDDAILIRNEAYITDLGNLPGSVIRDAEFRQNSIELYRPLQNISFITDSAIGGFKPGMFHFTNMLLHLASVIMLFLLLEAIGFDRMTAFAGGFVLAVHPVFTFTVNWLPARGDLLLAFWSILSVYLFIIFLKNKQRKWLWWHLAAFLPAIMSKETALIIIPVCFFYYIYFTLKPGFKLWQWIPFTGYLIITGIYLVMRKMAISGIQGGAFGIMPFIHNLPVIPETIFRFFVPYPMVALPFYSLLPSIGGTIAIAIIAVLSIKATKQSGLILFGTAWFIGFTLPSMLYRPDWSNYIYDYLIHRSYLPLAGIIIIILEIYRQNRHRLTRKITQGTVIPVFIIFAILSFSLSGVFKSPLTFWKHAVRTNKNSAFTHLYYGGALFFNNRHNQAIESYSRALELKPDLEEALINRGITYASSDDHRSAVDDFSRYLELMQGDTMAIRYRATSLLELAEYKKALPDLLILRSQGDRTEKVKYSIGLCNLLTGNYADAKKDFDSLLATNPGNISYLRVAALANLMSGETDQAIASYHKVLAVDPSANTLSNLGYAYWQKGMYKESLDYFIRADLISKDNLSIYLGMMLAYSSLGKNEDLIKTREKALTINPSLQEGAKSFEILQQEGYLFTPQQLDKLKSLF